jgi:hypothetical protein
LFQIKSFFKKNYFNITLFFPLRRKDLKLSASNFEKLFFSISSSNCSRGCLTLSFRVSGHPGGMSVPGCFLPRGFPFPVSIIAFVSDPAAAVVIFMGVAVVVVAYSVVVIIVVGVVDVVAVVAVVGVVVVAFAAIVAAGPGVLLATWQAGPVCFGVQLLLGLAFFLLEAKNL